MSTSLSLPVLFRDSNLTWWRFVVISSRREFNLIWTQRWQTQEVMGLLENINKLGDLLETRCLLSAQHRLHTTITRLHQ